MKSENCCRFVGQLVSFTVNEVGADKYRLGKGVLFLPDPEMPNIGQRINLMAWEDKADELNLIERGTWLNILSMYTPSTFRGTLQDSFTVIAVSRAI